MEQNFGIEVNYGNSIGYLGSPRYGIYNPNPMPNLTMLIAKTSSWSISPDYPNGYLRTTLAPRTLPNGVSNGLSLKNVSDDVVLQASDIESAVNRTNITAVSCVLFSNQRVVLGSANVIGNFNVNGRTETPNTGSDDVANIGKFYLGSSSGKMLFIFPLNTTLEQARTILAGTVIRYQLATPIDTLNTPFNNQITDLSGVVGKNLLPLFPGSVTSNGVTVTIVGDEITVNGTATTSNFFKLTNGLEANPARNPAWLTQTISEELTAFTNSITVISGTKSDGSFVIRNSDDAANGIVTSTIPVTFTATKRLCYGYLFFPIGTVFNNYKVKIQLELGSIATAYEPYGKANGLLTNFGGTTSSGYVVDTNAGKTFTMLKFDGIDDYGLAANHPNLDIIGNSDFGFGDVVKVPSLVTHYQFTKSEQSEATTQYGLKITNTGVLSIILEGTLIQLATGLSPNTIYAVWVERISGVLKCFINGIEVFSVANNTSLTSRPNFRIGAMSTNVGGTTHTGLSNASVGFLSISKTNVLQSRNNFFKFTKDRFGV